MHHLSSESDLRKFKILKNRKKKTNRACQQQLSELRITKASFSFEHRKIPNLVPCPTCYQER